MAEKRVTVLGNAYLSANPRLIIRRNLFRWDDKEISR